MTYEHALGWLREMDGYLEPRWRSGDGVLQAEAHADGHSVSTTFTGLRRL